MTQVEAPPGASVRRFKDLVEERLGVPAALQRLYVKGAHMEDERPLEHYHVTADSHVALYVAANEGAGSKKPEMCGKAAEVTSAVAEKRIGGLGAL